jgi:hypothetical protein
MKRNQAALSVFPLLLCILLTGCGKDVFFPATPVIPATPGAENWLFLGTYEIGADIMPYTFGGSLLNDSGKLSGVFHADQPCFGSNTTDIPYTGTMDTANRLSITSSSVGGQVLTVRGTLSADETILNDFFFSVAGGCTGNISESGEDSYGIGFSRGVKIPALTGTWTSGAMNSGSSITSFTEQITQSSTADVHGGFTLAGTVTIQGSPCFSRGTLQSTSFVSGYLGHELILMDDGSTLDVPMQVEYGFVASEPMTLNVGTTTVSGGNCNGKIESFVVTTVD